METREVLVWWGMLGFIGLAMFYVAFLFAMQVGWWLTDWLKAKRGRKDD